MTAVMSFLALFLLTAGLSVLAEDGQADLPIKTPPTAILKKKILCTSKYKGKQYDKDNQLVADINEEDVPSDVTMTIWKNDSEEFHFAEGTTYGSKTAVQSQYFGLVKITRSVVDGKTVELLVNTNVQNWTGDVIGNGATAGSRISESKHSLETTYEDLGSGKRRVVKVIADGKEQHAGDIETEYQFTDDVSVKTTIGVVPYKYEIPSGGHIDVSLDEQVCTTTIIH